jgi:hypothetical protein
MSFTSPFLLLGPLDGRVALAVEAQDGIGDAIGLHVKRTCTS